MFTDKQLKHLSPRDSAYRVFESGSDSGLCARVTPKGSTTFEMRYTSPITNKRRYFRLGNYPQTSLKAARLKCREAHALLDEGKDPALEFEKRKETERQQLEQERRQREIAESTGTLEQLMTDYKLDCIHRGIKKATTAEIQRIIDKELPAYLKNQKACDVKPEHIRDLLRGIYKRNAVRQADCVRSYLMAAYNYGLKAEFDVKRESSTSYRLSFNPVAAIPRIQPIRAGDRNLSQAEIHTLWNALDDAPCNAFSRTVLRLLLVTGQRVQEVTGMRWDELDLNTQLWRLPSNRTKNKQPHTLPLTDLAIELLDPLRQWQGISEFVFPHRTDPSQPMPWRSITWATSQLCKQLDIPSFSPKDLRRTVKSRMADVPISKEIRDRIQNHALHDVSSKHYDRANYLPQMREAMTQWDSWLRGTIAQPYPGSEQPQDSQTRE